MALGDRSSEASALHGGLRVRQSRDGAITFVFGWKLQAAGHARVVWVQCVRQHERK